METCHGASSEKLSKSLSISRAPGCAHRQIFLTKPGDSDIMATASKSFQPNMHKQASPVHSLVPDLEVEVDALSLSWESLNLYAFLSCSMVNKIMTQLQTQLIAPGWPSMPWFWDLVMLSQILKVLIHRNKILSQLFNRNLQMDLSSLNQHGILELWPSKTKASLTKWQDNLPPAAQYQKRV